jgi:hypothetical protein
VLGLMIRVINVIVIGLGLGLMVNGLWFMVSG